MNPLLTTQKEQDALFDEKFPRFDVKNLGQEIFPDWMVEENAKNKNEVLLCKQHNRRLEIIKTFMHSRDLAIETAVRAELVGKVKKLDLHPTPLYSTNGNAWDYNFVHRDEVLALLTTSPSP